MMGFTQTIIGLKKLNQIEIWEFKVPGYYNYKRNKLMTKNATLSGYDKISCFSIFLNYLRYFLLTILFQSNTSHT